MNILKSMLAACLFLFCLSMTSIAQKSEWIPLFNGKTLGGWKASEHPGTFSVVNGEIVVSGERAHLFYTGDVNNHDFRNFEFKAKVMTTPGSNSGIYVHTQYQEEGWPANGYEVQVNATHADWRKTASLYAVQDVKEAPNRDNEWFTMHIIVQGKKITIKVNDAVVNEYTESGEGRLSHGTFALQGHDPKSKVFYKDIRVKVLPD